MSDIPPYEKEWDLVEKRKGAWGGETHRMPVPGGWLYRCREWGGEDENFAIAMTFVPDQEPAWNG